MRKEFAVPGSSYGAHAGCQTFAVDVINGLSSHIKHNCIDQLDIVKAVGIIRLKQKKKHCQCIVKENLHLIYKQAQGTIVLHFIHVNVRAIGEGSMLSTGQHTNFQNMK